MLEAQGEPERSNACRRANPGRKERRGDSTEWDNAMPRCQDVRACGTPRRRVAPRRCRRRRRIGHPTPIARPHRSPRSSPPHPGRRDVALARPASVSATTPVNGYRGVTDSPVDESKVSPSGTRASHDRSSHTPTLRRRKVSAAPDRRVSTSKLMPRCLPLAGGKTQLRYEVPRIRGRATTPI